MVFGAIKKPPKCTQPEATGCSFDILSFFLVCFFVHFLFVLLFVFLSFFLFLFVFFFSFFFSSSCCSQSCLLNTLLMSSWGSAAQAVLRSHCKWVNSGYDWTQTTRRSPVAQTQIALPRQSYSLGLSGLVRNPRQSALVHA